MFASNKGINIRNSFFMNKFHPIFYSSNLLSSCAIYKTQFSKILDSAIVIDSDEFKGKSYNSRQAFDAVSVTIIECGFYKCGKTNEVGGALYINTDSKVDISQSGFTQCFAKEAGTIYCKSSNLTMTYNCFDKSTSSSKYSILQSIQTNQLTITQCFFTSCEGTESISINAKEVTITNSEFKSNNCHSSSLITTSSTTVVLRDLLFENNSGNLMLDITLSTNEFADSAIQVIKFNSNTAKSLIKASSDVQMFQVGVFSDSSETIISSTSKVVTFRDSMFEFKFDYCESKLGANGKAVEALNKFEQRAADMTAEVRPSQKCWENVVTPAPETPGKKLSSTEIAVIVVVVILVAIVIIFLIRRCILSRKSGMMPLLYTV
ncbi:hypothetical protein GPJ56_003282 [Histomonas meleagridis]|uniref:uncharacterized protein n=1 Tax=Histomonas meleagridis TaxID=135588 RepID=UPI0035599473|nr:hypothetical protein GPJ56_003282 [Histomonas meleagridis]KAH0805943.1 hypothetical protein GO595_001274 [Histomonas meleagridis]